MKIREKVIELISVHLGINNATQRLDANDDLSQLGMNSLTFIKLVVSIENELGLEFEDEALNNNKFASLSALCAYVEDRINMDQS